MKELEEETFFFSDPETIVKECQCGDCKNKKLLLQSNEPWIETKQLLM
jgi:hypothetical protein